MRNKRDRNDTDVLIETYTIRIENHKKEVKELKKLAKKFQKYVDEILEQPPSQTLIFANNYGNRIDKIKEEIASCQESIADYRYDIKRLKKILKKEDLKNEGSEKTNK